MCERKRQPPKPTTSRDAIKLFLGKGTKLYEPFFQICTIGLVASTSIATGDTDAVTDGTMEYKNAIPFGRPLFARMLQKNELTDKVEHSILKRMTLSRSEWYSSKEACLSILAT